MNKFSPLKAAFSGIDFIKNNMDFSKKFILVFTIVYTLYYIALAQLGYFENLREIFSLFQTMEPQTMPSEMHPPNQGMQLGLATLTMFAYLALSAAAQRKMLRGEETGFHGFTWGKDENRMLLSILILSGMYVGFVIVFSIVAVIIAVPLIMRDPNNSAMMMIALAILIIALLPLAAFFMTRFSQYGVMCVAKRKIGVWESWRETKSQFWSFLGAHLIVYGAMMLVMALTWYFAIKTFGAAHAPKTALEFFHPLIILPTIISSAMIGALTLCANSVGAYAFYVMHGGEGVLESETEKQGWPTPS